MGRHNRRNPRSPKLLYSRATVVVVNQEGNVLLVKHNRQREWALPGGQIRATEEPSDRAKLEMAEEVGLTIGEVAFAGRYAGSVGSCTSDTPAASPLLTGVRLVSQYGLLHLGQTRGSASKRGTHSCLHRSHLYPAIDNITFGISTPLLLT